MSYSLFWSLMSSLIAVPAVFLYLLTLTDQWRLTPRKRWPLLSVLVVVAVGAQLMCFSLLGVNAQGKLVAGFVGMSIASAAFFMLSSWRHGRALFLMLTSVVLSSICSTVITLLRLPYGLVHLALKLALNLLFVLVLYRFFRPGLRTVLQLDAPVWYGLSLIPGLFVASFSILLPYWLLPEQTYVMTPLLFLLCGFVLCTYIGFLFFFRILNAQYEVGRDAAVLNALARRAETEQRSMGRVQNRSAELVQFLEQVSHCLQAGDHGAALSLVGGMDARLTARPVEARRFTSDPLLNAVLGYYSEWAEETGVTLTIRFQLPPHFELDSAGLAVVLSNALENAMHACLDLPPDAPRTIRLMARNTPGQFFLQIENTCVASVTLDPATGLPVAREAGHGYGTKSIAAFASAHGGILQYSTGDGIFSIKLLF